MSIFTSERPLKQQRFTGPIQSAAASHSGNSSYPTAHFIHLQQRIRRSLLCLRQHSHLRPDARAVRLDPDGLHLNPRSLPLRGSFSCHSDSHTSFVPLHPIYWPSVEAAIVFTRI